MGSIAEMLQQQAGLTAPYPLMPQQTHLPQAEAAMNLSPQEQGLYMRHVTNLYGPGGVDNAPTPEEPGGSRSTLYQTVEPHDGKFYNIPTVWDGKRETEPYTRQDGSTLDVANPTALSKVAKTGWNTFPSYPTADAADARYGQMHDYLDKDTSDYFNRKAGQ